MERQAAVLVRDDRGFSPASRLLPRSVRFLGAVGKAGRVCEFEVLTGNAAYQKGEHFYLTAEQARRAYFPPPV